MGEERQSGGDHIKKQLNRWRKKYIIDKPNKRGSKYTILGEIQGADKLVLPKRSKYAIYIDILILSKRNIYFFDEINK